MKLEDLERGFEEKILTSLLIRSENLSSPPQWRNDYLGFESMMFPALVKAFKLSYSLQWRHNFGMQFALGFLAHFKCTYSHLMDVDIYLLDDP